MEVPRNHIFKLAYSQLALPDTIYMPINALHDKLRNERF